MGCPLYGVPAICGVRHRGVFYMGCPLYGVSAIKRCPLYGMSSIWDVLYMGFPL